MFKKVSVSLGLMLAASLTLSAGSYSVYVGYADGLRGGADFPTPFAVGDPFGAYTVGLYSGNTCGGCDSGAVMIVNTGSTALTLNDLSVNNRANATTYAIWGGTFSGGGYSLGVGKTAIFLENSGNNFDTSDFGGNTQADTIAGFNANTNNCSTGAIALLPQCVNNSPLVTFMVDGVSTTLTDSGHVLDTGGFDTANYVHHHSDGTDSTNESLQWRLIGTTGIDDPGGSTPEPGTLLMLGTGLAAIVGSRYRAMRA